MDKRVEEPGENLRKKKPLKIMKFSIHFFWVDVCRIRLTINSRILLTKLILQTACETDQKREQTVGREQREERRE